MNKKYINKLVWSIVTKDIPSNCVAAWNPCRVIKYI